MLAIENDWRRAVFDHAQEGLALLSADGRVLHANQRWLELVNVPVGQVVPGQFRPGGATDLPTSTAGTTQTHVRRVPPVPVTHQDGRRAYVECSIGRLTIAGEPMEIAAARDVTDAVNARHAIAASERCYRTLIENLPDVVWSASLDGRLTFISPNVARVCGFTAEELLAAPASFWFDRTHPEDALGLYEAHHSTAPGGSEAEYRWLAKDGQWRWIRTRASLGVAESGEVFAHGTFADVTAQKHLEAQIRQAQKLEALGLLTGGIAHDFNNILTVVIGSGELLRTSLEPTDVRRDEVEAILEAGQRAAALTRQLVAFSRREIREPRTLNLNQIVTDLMPMLRRVIGEDITLTLRLQPDLATVRADAGQLEQVLMHLAVNARDAMPRGGQLTIETATVALNGQDADADGAVGEFVMLAVSDTGRGMDEETRRRVFEPFFTTKMAGSGTGLGLATCYGIIKQSDGHIVVRSALGAGTTFRVYLPRPMDVDDLPTSDDTSHGGRLTGSETVLLVEDDEHVRSTVERVLTRFGYRVITAIDGDDAQAAAVTHGGPVHLILSDVVMPGAAGPDVVQRLCELLDTPRVLFMSGYTDHALLRGAVTETRVHFLQKPFLPVTLLQRVREVLDA